MLEHLMHAALIVHPVIGDLLTNGADTLAKDAGPIAIAAVPLTGAGVIGARALGYQHAADWARNALVAAAIGGALVYGADFFLKLFHA